MINNKLYKLTGVIIVFLVLISFFACSSPSPTVSSTPKITPASTPTPTSTAPSSTPTAADIRQRTFSFASNFAETADFHQQLIQVFANKVSDLSGGKMQVKIYPNSTLGKQAEQSVTIGTGRADMGNVSVPAEAGKFPLMEGLTSLPSFWSEYKYFCPNVRATVEKFPELQAELKKQNLQYLYSQNSGLFFIFMRKPVNSLQDVKGRLVRGSGGVMSKEVEAIGLTPVTMASGDVYVSIQKGTIDGTVSALNSYLSESMNEVAPYALGPGIFFAGGIEAINLDTNSLNKTEQDLLIKAAKLAEQNLAKYRYTADEQDRKTSQAKKVLWAQMTAAEVTTMHNQLDGVTKGWLANKGPTGQAMLDFAQQLQKVLPAY